MTRDSGPGHNDARGAVRFTTELIAWIAVPWALWPHSRVLAVGAVVLLIALPATFGTPGDRPGGDAPVAVPGAVSVALVVLQIAAATTAAWFAWPVWAAVAVTALCLLVPFTEQPRWHKLCQSHP